MDDNPSQSPDIALAANTHIDDANPALGSALGRMKGEQLRHSRADGITPAQLQEFPHLGRFMPPRQNSYAAHFQLCSDSALALHFSPTQQPAFDAPLAPSAPVLLQPTLAVLRNAILQQFFAAGYAPKRAQHMQAIARYLAAQFVAGRADVSPNGAGAQALYCMLLARQNTPLWRMPSAWLDAANRSQRWGLAPLEQSPFSDAALRLAAPLPDTLLSAVADVRFGEMVDRNSFNAPAPSPQNEALTTAEELSAIADDLAAASTLTLSIDSLHEPTRREAIEIAKDILDKLRLGLGEALIMNGLSAFDINPLTLLNDLKKVVKAFEFHLHKVAGLDAKIYDNPAIAAAIKAIGKLSFFAKQETLKAAVALGDTRMIARLQQDLNQMPRAFIPTAADRFTHLFDDLESGLKTAIDRMNHLANKDASAESWLGFSAEKALGNQPHEPKGAAKPQQAMQDDSFYRQLNAQRALVARQAAVRYTQQQQRQQHDHHHDAPHAAKEVSATQSANLNQLLSNDVLASMRNAMKTSANAAAVETSTKANLQQVIKQKEQASKAQRQRTTQEQLQRASERSKEAQTDTPPAQQPIAPPFGKKKDPKLGM